VSVLTLAIALIAISIPSKGREAAKDVARGKQLVGANHPEAAFVEFKKALSVDAQAAGAHEGRAIAYLQMDKYQEALPELELAIQQSPKDASLENFRGNALSGLNRNEEALQAYTRALAIDLKSDALLNRASIAIGVSATVDVRRKDQLLSQAVEDCQAAEQVFPKRILVYLVCANAFRASGRLSEALTYANKGVDLGRDNPDAYMARGLVYQQMRDDVHWQADVEAIRRLQRK